MHRAPTIAHLLAQRREEVISVSYQCELQITDHRSLVTDNRRLISNVFYFLVDK